MIIEVLSRKDFEEFESNIPFIAISITDPGSEYAETNSQPLARLNLQFWDLDKDTAVFPYSRQLFTKEMANQILDFVDSFKDKVDLIVIHCEASISRSAGVAGALGKILNDTDKKFFMTPYTPNMLVYRTILNAYYNI